MQKGLVGSGEYRACRLTRGNAMEQVLRDFFEGWKRRLDRASLYRAAIRAPVTCPS